MPPSTWVVEPEEAAAAAGGRRTGSVAAVEAGGAWAVVTSSIAETYMGTGRSRRRRDWSFSQTVIKFNLNSSGHENED